MGVRAVTRKWMDSGNEGKTVPVDLLMDQIPVRERAEDAASLGLESCPLGPASTLTVAQPDISG